MAPAYAALSKQAAQARRLLFPVLPVDCLLADPKARSYGFPGQTGLPGAPDECRFGATHFLVQFGNVIQRVSRTLAVHRSNQCFHSIHLHFVNSS
jgi:hypothetical protein